MTGRTAHLVQVAVKVRVEFSSIGKGESVILGKKKGYTTSTGSFPEGEEGQTFAHDETVTPNS